MNTPDKFNQDQLFPTDVEPELAHPVPDLSDWEPVETSANNDPDQDRLDKLYELGQISVAQTQPPTNNVPSNTSPATQKRSNKTRKQTPYSKLNARQKVIANNGRSADIDPNLF